MSRDLVHRWLPFSAVSATALAVWGLAAVHGYGWPMIWLPAAVAGAAWPRRRTRLSANQCRGRMTDRR